VKLSFGALLAALDGKSARDGWVSRVEAEESSEAGWSVAQAKKPVGGELGQKRRFGQSEVESRTHNCSR